MSETETETTPAAPESADSNQPAVVTLAEPTPAENGVSGTAMRAEYGGHPTLKEYREAQAKRAGDAVSGANLDDIARHCGGGGITMSQIGLRKHLPKLSADSGKPAVTTLTEPTLAENGVYAATGIEAAVCADIAKRQRRGIAKYGTTVIGNLLSFHQWLTHFYEELLDAAIYAKRIIHDHENQNHSSAAGVLPSNPNPVRIPRKPGGGRKPLVCPSCGGIKTIGSSMKDGIPIKRCRVCGHVHKSYPHLANAAKAAT